MTGISGLVRGGVALSRLARTLSARHTATRGQ